LKQASFPEMYERWLVAPLFRPWAEVTLDEVGLSPGDSLLDVACGTGIVARVARERLGGGERIVGVDVSAPMLAVARGVAPDIDWREGNAIALPLEEGERFDVVACQQGMQFFTDKPAAAAEMRRALAGGGRLAATTWRSEEENPFLRQLRAVAERHLGAIADQRHSFGDADRLAALLAGAGFSEVRVRTVTRTIRFEDGVRFLRMNVMALIGMSAGAAAMGEAERERVLEAIVAESEPVSRRHADGPRLAFELGANLATARG
jgi:ubiquinone/menaquinone biosynthesis C-methylase UbiE